MSFIGSRNRRIAQLSCGTLLMTVALATYGASSTNKEPVFPAESTMAKIQFRGELRVGIKTSVPLFGQRNPMTGEVDGLDAEMARLIGRAIFGSDGHVKFIGTPSAAREMSIMKDKVDLVIATYTITPSRLKEVSFAGPYYDSRFGILVLKDDNSFGSALNKWSDLNGHSVCSATNGTNYLNVQKYAPNAKLFGFEDEDKCVTLMSQKRVESYAAEIGILLGVMSRNPGQFKIIPNKGSKIQPYGIGLKKGDTKFCKWINAELIKSFKDGQWAASYKKTIGKVTGQMEAPPSPESLKYCE